MSTKLTQNGTPMVESQSLKLLFASRELYDTLSTYVLTSLQSIGYEDLSLASLQFLGALDCGINYASEIARQLGVSRQMVAKTVKELSELGYLKQESGLGKKKAIMYTLKGEKLIAVVRQILAELDQQLTQQVSHADIQRMLAQFIHLQEAL